MPSTNAITDKSIQDLAVESPNLEGQSKLIDQKPDRDRLANTEASTDQTNQTANIKTITLNENEAIAICEKSRVDDGDPLIEAEVAQIPAIPTNDQPVNLTQDHLPARDHDQATAIQNGQQGQKTAQNPAQNVPTPQNLTHNSTQNLSDHAEASASNQNKTEGANTINHAANPSQVLPNQEKKPENSGDFGKTVEMQDKEKKEKAKQLERYRQFLAAQELSRKIDHQQVRLSIEAGALPSKMYFGMNGLAAIIASYGLITNSPAVVIGAMLVAMMLGPITGVALAVIDYRFPLLRKSLFTVLSGGVLVIAIGFLVGWLHEGQPLTHEILSRTQPTSMDLMIALAGGIAGAYAMISPHLPVAVVGVAVATALVPPLAASGILFANGETSLGLGALLLSITNIIAIQFTNALVLWFAGFRHLVADDYKSGTFITFLRRNAISLVLLAVLAIYLTVNFNKISQKQRFENFVKQSISEYFLDRGNVLTATQFSKRDGKQIIRAVIRGESKPTVRDVWYLQKQINQRLEKHGDDLDTVHLQLRYLPVQVIELTAQPEQLDQTDAAILTNPSR